MDIRVQRHAQVLVDYSLKIKKGDRFVIVGSTEAAPLIRETYRLGLRRGAFTDVAMSLPGIEWIYYTEANKEQIARTSPLTKVVWEKFNKVLFVGGDHNTRALAGVPVEKLKTKMKAFNPIRSAFYKRSDQGTAQWLLTTHPTVAQAQEANMSLERYQDFVYAACFCDKANPVQQWKELAHKQDLLIKKMNLIKEIHIVGPGTDLRASLVGRRWCNSYGSHNMPDGEVFTGPVENSVNGHVRFSFPGVYLSQDIEDISLEFKNGVVVKAKATKGQDLLERLLDTDAGARRLGELAIGTNYGIKEFTKKILFDEKLGGTVHMAIGYGYAKDTGSKNKSIIHWDMIADMKKGGKIFGDGVLIYESGRFLKGWL